MRNRNIRRRSGRWTAFRSSGEGNQGADRWEKREDQDEAVGRVSGSSVTLDKGEGGDLWRRG